MTAMETKQTIDELIRQIVELAHPLQIFLFGSVAKGGMSVDSDIDLLVVMPDGTHRRKTAQRLYMDISNIKTAFDLVVATASDLDRHGENSGLIYRAALKEGKLLYAA
ncbi:MAG: nucleotidyltransferase domain-containing protein [Kiritimatiellales bacterium]|nr:nucleotidyltransferase domain-containing protein [Kiritimatiellales bacterium]